MVAAAGMLVVAGCSTTGTMETESPVISEQVVESQVIEEEAEPEVKPRPKPEDYPVAPFEGDTLYELLAAEIAGYRSRYDVALDKYLAAAEETQDPGVAARATRLAIYMKQNEAALQTVTIWAEQDPGDIDAHRHATDLLLKANRLEEAIEHMEAVKNLGGLAKFEIFAFRAANLDEAARKSLLEAITRMLERHPEDEQLMFSKAVLLEQDGQHEEALLLADRLLQISENINVVILKVGLLNDLELQEEAKSFLEEKITVLPENRRLRLILAQLLFETDDLEAARAQYLIILQKAPNDGDILFALALIALEQRDDIEAQRYFERMVRWNRRVGEAHYYLGGI